MQTCMSPSVVFAQPFLWMKIPRLQRKLKRRDVGELKAEACGRGQRWRTTLYYITSMCLRRGKKDWAWDLEIISSGFRLRDLKPRNACCRSSALLSSDNLPTQKPSPDRMKLAKLCTQKPLQCLNLCQAQTPRAPMPDKTALSSQSRETQHRGLVLMSQEPPTNAIVEGGRKVIVLWPGKLS